MAKGLEGFMVKRYLHNIQSVLVTRERKVTENYVFRFLSNSNLERQLLQNLLQ